MAFARRTERYIMTQLCWFSFLLLADVTGKWGVAEVQEVHMVGRAVCHQGGAFSLFMLRSAGEPEYQQMTPARCPRRMSGTTWGSLNESNCHVATH
jgi:hypothetical protein